MAIVETGLVNDALNAAPVTEGAAVVSDEAMAEFEQEFTVKQAIQAVGIRAAEKEVEVTQPSETIASPTLATDQPQRTHTVTYIRRAKNYGLLAKNDEADIGKRMAAGVKARKKLVSNKLSDSEREQALGIISNADTARETLITSNLLWVIKIANSYTIPRGMTRDDLIQAGNEGLLHAADGFDYRRGFKFSTYSRNWIKQSISRAIGQQSRLASIGRETVRRTRQELYETNGNIDEIDPQLVPAARAMDHLSLSASTHSTEEKMSLLGVLPVTDGDVAEEAIEHIRLEMARSILTLDEVLTLEERQILALYYGFIDNKPLSQMKIGLLFNKSEGWARNRIMDALNKVRVYFGEPEQIEARRHKKASRQQGS